MNANKTKKIVVLATGGTISGLALNVARPHEYLSGQVCVEDLLKSIPPNGIELLNEQVAQIDSKDMSFAIWQSLLGRVAFWLAQDDVQGVVVTHGTDTLEETAYFLQTVLQPIKPLALTCAMLPANVLGSDGPGNLSDALAWVQLCKKAIVNSVIRSLHKWTSLSPKPCVYPPWRKYWLVSSGHALRLCKIIPALMAA
jgi:L-asparaginase